MSLVNAAISVAISLAVFIVFASILEAMRRRGLDPVADIARFISPDVTLSNGANGAPVAEGIEA